MAFRCCVFTVGWVSIPPPCMLIVGSGDPYCAHMEWLAEHIPSATLCALDGVGHFPFVEASAQFTQLVAAFINDYDHTAV